MTYIRPREKAWNTPVVHNSLNRPLWCGPACGASRGLLGGLMPAEPAPLARPFSGHVRSWYICRAKLYLSVQVQLTHLRWYIGNLPLPGPPAWTLLLNVRHRGHRRESTESHSTAQCLLPHVRSCQLCNCLKRMLDLRPAQGDGILCRRQSMARTSATQMSYLARKLQYCGVMSQQVNGFSMCTLVVGQPVASTTGCRTTEGYRSEIWPLIMQPRHFLLLQTLSLLIGPQSADTVALCCTCKIELCCTCLCCAR